MSANNWAICPRCNKAEDDKRAALVKRLATDYGKVSMEKYAQLQAALSAPRPALDTLREDWEIGMDTSGEFVVTYSCSCAKCGFAFEYADSRLSDC